MNAGWCSRMGSGGAKDGGADKIRVPKGHTPMPPEPLPSPHHPRTKATTTSSNEQPRSCDTEVELVRMEVLDMTSYCIGVLRYREAWFRTWRNMCRPDARLERGRQNRAWTRLSNPTCPFWGNVPTITSRPARPMHPPTRRGSHGIRSRRPWSVRWLSRWSEASHTHAVDDRSMCTQP